MRLFGDVHLFLSGNSDYQEKEFFTPAQKSNNFTTAPVVLLWTLPSFCNKGAQSDFNFIGCKSAVAIDIEAH